MMSGPTATASLVVGPEHTAIEIGSGDVPVLATPCLIALCEQATVAAVAELLDADETSVGVHIDVEHVGATAPGATVVVTAELLSADGGRLVCSVTARQGSRLVGRGTIVRARVHRQRFLDGLETS